MDKIDPLSARMRGPITSMFTKLSFVAALAVFAVVAVPGSARAMTDMFYTFNAPGVLVETGSMGGSSSPYFWLNSGGYLIIKDGVGQTVQGSLPYSNPWRLLYGQNNPLDTDNGYNPQNLFRLVTKSTWGDVEETVSFRITNVNETDTPNRGGYSGILLFGRYQDGNNLYYAGIRDDGEAIIKKKINGSYHTLATVQIFGWAGKYDKEALPSLLPVNKWTGLKMTIENAYDGSVLIRLYLDRENDGSFVSILSARDRGAGGAPLREAAHAGIRTDYKDVQFDNYHLRAL